MKTFSGVYKVLYLAVFGKDNIIVGIECKAVEIIGK
jgi:hypothetical protein